MQISALRNCYVPAAAALATLALSAGVFANDSASEAMRIMDADHDGKVTAAEHDACWKKMHDGKEGRDRMSSAEKIKTIDSDKDGMLTAAEHEAGARTMFSKMDSDADGVLTAAEIKAGHEKMMSAKTPASGTSY